MKPIQSALLLAAVLPIGANALVIQPLPEVVTPAARCQTQRADHPRRQPHPLRHRPQRTQNRLATSVANGKNSQHLLPQKHSMGRLPHRFALFLFRQNLAVHRHSAKKTRRASSNATANIAETPIIFTSIRPIGTAATPCLQAATRKTSPCVSTARHRNSATAP